MNDEMMRRLERELAGLRPGKVAGKVTAGIAEGLGEGPLTVGDRILAGFVGCGALAAAVIVGIVVLGAATAAPALPQQDRVELAARQRMMMEYQALLAQR